MSNELKVSARVTVTLELYLPDRWTPDVGASQVYEQAGCSAKFLLEKLFEASARGELRVNDAKQHLRGHVLDCRTTMIMAEEVKP